MEYGFKELNLHRLWTELYDFDTKKIEMFQKLGFVQEGRHRETHWTDEKWCDSVYFSFLKTDGGVTYLKLFASTYLVDDCSLVGKHPICV